MDAPASGDWTPDNLNADESALSADDVILEAAEWEDVRVVAFFETAVNGTETVDVTPLRALPNAPSPSGRLWVPLAPVTLAPQLGSSLVRVDAGLIAFRITALTLGTATKVGIIVTGGAYRRGR